MDNRLRFMAGLTQPLTVPPGSTVKLSRDHDPGYTGQVTKDQATALLADGVQLLAEYQDRLAAQDTYGVLLVLVQALHAINPRYPAADPAVRGEMLQAGDELRAELAAGKADAA